jgi:hypothetical protein
MEDQQISEGSVMKVSTGFKLYFTCLAVFSIALSIAVYISHDSTALIALAVYLGCGVYLNRVILRNLFEFHPMYSTLDNVFRTKWNLIVIWPIGYLSLLIKLGVNKLV